MTRIKSFYQYLILQVSDLSCNLSSILPFYSRSVDSQLFTLETNNESRRLFRIKSRIGYSRILRGCRRRWHELYTYSTVYFYLLLQTFECLGSVQEYDKDSFWWRFTVFTILQTRKEKQKFLVHFQIIKYFFKISVLMPI